VDFEQLQILEFHQPNTSFKSHRSSVANQTSPNTTNWLVVEPPTPLKNDGLKVSWDDDSIPSFWKVIIKFHGSKHHQPGFFFGSIDIP